MNTVKVLDVKVNATWLQELFKSIAVADSDFVSNDKESYVNGRIDSLYELLDDKEFALSIKEQAIEDNHVVGNGGM